MSKRKGFRKEPTVYRLTFEGGDLAGLEVTARSLPLREFFELQQLQGAAEEDAGASEKIIRKLAGVLAEWNLEDEDGEQIAVGYETLADQELPFVMAIFEAWMEAVASVPNRSRPGSNSSGTSAETSIPMDTL